MRRSKQILALFLCGTMLSLQTTIPVRAAEKQLDRKACANIIWSIHQNAAIFRLTLESRVPMFIQRNVIPGQRQIQKPLHQTLAGKSQLVVRNSLQ